MVFDSPGTFSIGRRRWTFPPGKAFFQRRQLDTEHLLVPSGVERQPVIGNH